MNEMVSIHFLSAVFVSLFTIVPVLATLRDGECEVCIGVLQKFEKTIPLGTKQFTLEEIEDKFRDFCKTKDGREDRFCFYIGASKDSVAGIMRFFSTEWTKSVPVIKICEKLKNQIGQICELRYEKKIDFKTVDLKKLKVKDLKNILNSWDETCEGCIEKTDFISRIEELKPKYVKEEL